MKFCEAIGKYPLPATERTLVLFTAHLSGSVGYSTVRAYMSAVRHLHLSKGYADPFLAVPQLDLVFKGVKRLKPSGQDRRLPITPIVLRDIWEVVQRTPTDYTNIMMWAACCLGYFAFLRCGEFTVNDPFDPGKHLEISDIAVDSYEIPTMISVFLKQSKTDQDKSGIKLFLGRTNQDLCPVVAVLAYLGVRKVGSTTALFVQDGGNPLSRAALVAWLKSTLRVAGVDSSFFTGHSFRIGAASTAAAKGVEDSTIQALGRWKSDAFKRYIRIPRHQLAAFSSVIAN